MAVFNAPISGVVQDVNAELTHHLDWLSTRPYEKGWVCSMKPAHLAEELGQLKIGETAAAWYQTEIARLRQVLASAQSQSGSSATSMTGPLAEGELEHVDDSAWAAFTQAFLQSVMRSRPRAGTVVALIVIPRDRRFGRPGRRLPIFAYPSRRPMTCTCGDDGSPAGFSSLGTWAEVASARRREALKPLCLAVNTRGRNEV